MIEQAKYIFEQSQDVACADRYLDNMQAYITEVLARFPKSGRPSEELAKETRKLVYKGYSIIYRLTTEHIEVLLIYKENIPKL